MSGLDSIRCIRANDVSKRFGWHRALAKVSVELVPGSLCALLGANGAGKSTLLGILSTLVQPSSGEVAYEDSSGSPTRHGPELRKSIGVLAHESFVYSGLSAVENLEFWGQLYQVENLGERLRELLDRVGLDEKARERAAGTYSRGMSQRLALARVLLHDPSVLLLDEPFTGLDRKGVMALGESLRSAKAEGRLLVVITHDLEAIAGITDHVLMLDKGKVVHEERRVEGFSYENLKEIYHQHAQ